jgi:endoglucanase
MKDYWIRNVCLSSAAGLAKTPGQTHKAKGWSRLRYSVPKSSRIYSKGKRGHAEESTNSIAELWSQLWIFGFICLLNILFASKVDASEASFRDDMDAYNVERWIESDWANVDPNFLNAWLPDHIEHKEGMMVITLDGQHSYDREFSSGECKSVAKFKYGHFEAKLQAAKGAGIVTAFFLYDQTSGDEIDVEILGKDPTQMQVNYWWMEGNTRRKFPIDIPLGFDASTGMHIYAIDWSADLIRWYVDEDLVCYKDGIHGPLPAHPCHIMMSLWASRDSDWAGHYEYIGPVSAVYDWIQYTSPPGGGSDYLWVVTKGFSPEAGNSNGRALYGVRDDGTRGLVCLYKPAGLPPGSVFYSPRIRDDKVVFHAGADLSNPDRGDVYLGSLDSDDVQLISNFGYRNKPVGSIFWSATGDAVLLSNYGTGVSKMDTDPKTNDEVILTNNYFDEVSGMSSSSGRIYFDNFMYRKPFHTYSVAADGSDVQAFNAFTDGTYAIDGSISPDGSMIAIGKINAAGNARSKGVWLANPATGRLLTPTPVIADLTFRFVGDGFTAWSPDSQALALIQDGQLWRFNTDGSDYRQLTSDTFGDLRVWGAVSIPERMDDLRYKGVNLAGAEFGDQHLPGIYEEDYLYPNMEEVDYFSQCGMNTIRLPFRWERLQTELRADLDRKELARLKDFVSKATAKGLYVILDPHNYARYQTPTDVAGSFTGVIGSAEVPIPAFANFWSQVADVFKTNDKVIFGLMNEPYDIKVTEWVKAANAAIDAIRDTGATNLILVPGARWTGARGWIDSDEWGVPNADAMPAIRDKGNNFAYEVHQYFDEDNSGTSSDIASGGAECLACFTAWLKIHHFRGFLGEFAVANAMIGWDPQQVGDEVLTSMLNHIRSNADVWLGWTWWAAGPWWADYMFTLEPLNLGQADQTDQPAMTVLADFLREERAELTVTDVTLIQQELADGHYQDVGTVSDVAVGGFFRVEIEVTNQGDMTRTVANHPGLSFSGQGSIEHVGSWSCDYLLNQFEPGESVVLEAPCRGTQAYHAVQAGWVTMGIFVSGDCRDAFGFQVRSE